MASWQMFLVSSIDVEIVAEESKEAQMQGKIKFSIQEQEFKIFPVIIFSLNILQ